MNNKKNILFVNENSVMCGSGFAKIGREVISRIYDTNKYNVFELGNYAKTSDCQGKVPWTIYGSIPESNDQQGNQIYNSTMTAQFGSEAFDAICLKHKIDIVIAWSDWWMLEWIYRSSYRRHYKFIVMSCVDSCPQKPEWIEDYCQSDYVTVYTEFGKRVLEQESGGRIQINEIIRPGANHHVFKSLDKEKLRSEFNINKDSYILGFIGRAQNRKLHANLIEDFAKLINYSIVKGNDKIANNSYLLLYSSFPDVATNFPKYLSLYNISHRVLFCYYCQACKYYFISTFETEITHCKKCGCLSCVMPNTSNFIPEEGMAKICNLMDAYVQYSICEGYGMGIAEAKMCGVPAFGGAYSATEDQVSVEGCFPIKIDRMFWEADFNQTGQQRSYPCGDDFVKKMYYFLSLPKQERERLGKLAQKHAVENCNFDRAALLFEQIIDKISLTIEDHSKTWLNLSSNFAPNSDKIPQCTNNLDFIDYCIDNILGRPKLKEGFWKHELLKALNTGIYVDRGGKEHFTHETLVRMFKGMANKWNFWESKRLEMINPQIVKKQQWEMM